MWRKLTKLYNYEYTLISSDHKNEIQLFINHSQCPWILKIIRWNNDSTPLIIYQNSHFFREAAKKSHFLNGGDIKREGGKGLAIKKTEHFFILLPFKNKKYFTFDNLSTYGHIIMLSFSVGIFLVCYNIFQK